MGKDLHIPGPEIEFPDFTMSATLKYKLIFDF